MTDFTKGFMTGIAFIFILATIVAPFLPNTYTAKDLNAIKSTICTYK